MYCWLMSPKKGERGGRKSGSLLPETGAGAGVGVDGWRRDDGLDDRWMDACDWTGGWIHVDVGYIWIRTDCGVHTLVLVVQQCVQSLQCKLSE